MNRQDLLQDIRKILGQAGIDTAALDARLLLEKTLNIPREDLVIKAELDVSPCDEKQVRANADLRVSGMPISKIFGEKEFWGHPFKVTLDTLDPRPDSETLIEAVLNNIPDKSASLSILDIGTGTGCLVISLLLELKNASGKAVDISQPALKVAAHNACALGVSDRLTLQHQGWNDLDNNEKFDIVISNPPYISTCKRDELQKEVREYDPDLALYAGEDGLTAYEEISNILPDILKSDTGLAAFEIGLDQAGDVLKIFEKRGIKHGIIHQDLGKRDRCIIFQPAPVLKKT